MDSNAELPLATLLWQPRLSSWLVTIVCKATFKLEQKQLTLASAHEPVFTADAFWDDDENRSLSTASELVPSKPKADVIVVGSAFAPDGRPVRSLVVRLGFETIDKSVEIVTDRSVGPDGTVYQGPRFARMPLIYERAAGGPGTWNPVGVRKNNRDAYGRSALPNLTQVGKGDDVSAMPEPIGLGPIAANWPERAEKLGAAFAGRAWKNEPLPEGLDLGFFNMAPPDQQVDAIPEDAPLLLENLHREHAMLRTKLPGIRPRVTVTRRAGSERPAMRADTLWIDTDRALVSVTWRGHFSLEHQTETYRVTAEAERPRESWRTVEHASPPRRTLIDAEVTADGSVGLPLGFAQPAALASAPVDRAPARTVGMAGAGIAGALPFQRLVKGPRAPLPFSGALPFGATNPNEPVSKATVAWSSFTPPTQEAPVGPSAQAPVPAAPAAVVPAFSSHASPPPAMAVSSAHLPPAVVGSLSHASAAALGGLVSASNAAADPRAKAGPPALAMKPVHGDVLVLIWFNPDSAARVRRRPEWKKLLDQLEQGPFDPEVDEPALADAPAEMEDRREVYEVLAHAKPTSQDSVDGALLDAVRADGRFSAQLLLLSGELRFDFDEIETLKAVVSAATPFTENDDALKRSVHGATQFLATPGLVAAPDVATAMTTKVREAFAASDRSVPGSYLDDQTERALLERRAYQKRTVFGEPHLRASFFFAGSHSGIPAYLPEHLGKRLPLFRQMRVRILVEAHFQADQFESHAAALRAVAVARIVR